MAKVKLTAGRIVDFQCNEGKAQAFLWCDAVAGLGVRATAGSTAKRYIFQAKVKGKSMRVTIGDANCLNKKVTEGVYQEDTLPQIVGNRTKWGLSTWVSMRNGFILRRYASAITGPNALTRVRSWTSSVRCAAISASMPFGCWEANLLSHHDALDDLHNTTNPRWLRCCVGYGLQPIRCAASGWWLPYHFGCHTMKRALVYWMSRSD